MHTGHLRVPETHFQSEAKYNTFLVRMIFVCIRMSNHFHIKDRTLNLVLIQRSGGTWKWHGLEHQYGRHFIILGHQEDHRNVV